MQGAARRRTEELIGESGALRELRRQVSRIAPLRSTVLLCGETGVGKGLVARLLHRRSPRASAPFVHVDCATLAPQLAESELFGHERGSFTGALAKRVGRFEQASRGTIFLDEIGEVTPALQSKLLRVLQDREFERLGGNQTLGMTARVIAATSRDLGRAVVDAEFRADLYFRLNVVRLEIPPLRARRSDIPALAAAGMERLAAELDLPLPDLAGTALARLVAYDWPGNVRELMNVLERLLIHHAGQRLTPEQVEAVLADGRIPVVARSSRSPAIPCVGVRSPTEISADHIAVALRASEGNVARTARQLGIPRSTLRRWIRRHGIG